MARSLVFLFISPVFLQRCGCVCKVLNLAWGEMRLLYLIEAQNEQTNAKCRQLNCDYAQKEPSRVTRPHPQVHKRNILRERLNMNVSLRASATLASLFSPHTSHCKHIIKYDKDNRAMLRVCWVGSTTVNERKGACKRAILGEMRMIKARLRVHHCWTPDIFRQIRPKFHTIAATFTSKCHQTSDRAQLLC